MAHRTIAFITLGCAKNEVDSRDMKDRLREAGWELADEADKADVIVINTCAFIEEACSESIDTILDVASLSRVSEGECAIIVAGCLPSRYGEDLADSLPEISFFLPVANEESIVETAERAYRKIKDAKRNVAVIEEDDDRDEPLAFDPLAQDPVFAYVKIADGCDRRCSYCTIPSIRGPYQSLPREDIFATVKNHVDSGVREIVLIAQDSGRWGIDLLPKSDLSDLLNELAEAFSSTWFRVMYLQPEGVTDKLLSAMAAHPNICPYFAIPLQHVNPGILRNMHRSGSREEFHALFNRIFKALPSAVVRTTLIAGFPGETEEQFLELCDFLKEEPIDYAGVFPYSREEGTDASALGGQVDEDIKIERANELRTLADEVCALRLRRFIGHPEYVLIEGRELEGICYGRTMRQAPEVDGVTFGGCGETGEIVEVLITDTLLYDMEGE